MHEFSQFTYVNTESDGFLYMPLFRSGATCKLIYRNKKLSYTKAMQCLLEKKLKQVAPDLNLGM